MILKKQWVVIYYSDLQENCEVENFLNKLKDSQRVKALAWIDKLREEGPDLPRPFADLLKSGIHELRIKISDRQERILYFFVFRHYIILTHQFTKKGGKVPEREIKKANEIRYEFNSRFKDVNQFKSYLDDLEAKKIGNTNKN